MMTTMVLALVLATGCKDDKGGDTGMMGDGGGVDGGTTDGGADGGTGDGGTGDGGTGDGGTQDGGTGDGGATISSDMRFSFDGEWKGGTLTLTWVNPESFEGEPEFGDVIASEALGADNHELSIESVDSDHLVTIDEDTGLVGAFYVPAVHLDEDGDGLQTGEEPFLGVGDWFAVWIEGDIDTAWDTLGLQVGWNSIQFTDSGDINVGDPLDIPVDLGLSLNEEVTLSGTYAGPGTGNERLAILPAAAFEGKPVESFMYDAAMESPWSITLTGAPPDDHLQPDKDGLFLEMAIELPMAYSDRNGNEALDETDPPLYMACNEDGAVTLIWVPGVTDLFTGLVFNLYDLQPGWMAVNVDSFGEGKKGKKGKGKDAELAFIDPATLTDLVMDASCPFDLGDDGGGGDGGGDGGGGDGGGGPDGGGPDGGGGGPK